MHQASYFFSGRGKLFRRYAGNDIHGLGSGQVMAYRTDTAQALDENRNLPVRPPLNKTLEATELHHMKTGLRNAPLIIKMDGDLTVSLDSRYRFYRYFSGHGLKPQSYLIS